MTAENTPAFDPKLVDRVQGLLRAPKLEWPIIAAEQTTVKALFTRYAMVLAAIPVLSTLANDLVFSHRGPVSALMAAIVGYALALLGTYVIGIVIDGLAQNFGSEKNIVQSMKLAVYAMTPAWLAGILNVIGLDWLAWLIGLYGFYLFYLGLAPLKLTPADKMVVYTIVVVLVGIVLNAVIWGLIGAVIASFMIVGAGATAFALS